MKFLVSLLTLCVLGSAVASPGWLSAFSDTTNALRQTAVGAAKATTNAAVGAVKVTANVALNAVETSKNITVGAAKAGVNAVKDVSTGAIKVGLDFFISQMMNLVKQTGKNNMAIPDISQKAGPITFNATKGYFKDLATIMIDGKPNMTMNGLSIHIVVPIKLESIDIGFNQFNVTLWKMNVGGGIKINITEDSFKIYLSVTPGIKCTLNLEKVEVVKLSGYDVDFFNMGKTSEWVLEKSGSLIVNAMRGQIKNKVQQAVDSKLKEIIGENAALLCSKFTA